MAPPDTYPIQKAMTEAGVAPGPNLPSHTPDELMKRFGSLPLLHQPGETVVFSYIVFKSRAHRDRVNAKVMKEMEKMGEPKDMPFDLKRMVYGGFKVLVDA